MFNLNWVLLAACDEEPVGPILAFLEGRRASVLEKFKCESSIS